MRVGIFTDTYFPEKNGVANSAFQLKKGLEEMGHTVYVFTVTNPKVSQEEKNVFRMFSLPCVLIKERRIGLSVYQLWTKKVKELNLDVIHTQTEFTVGQMGKFIAKKENIPMLHTYHTIYEDYVHYLKVPQNHDKLAKEMVRDLSRAWCNRATSVVVPTEKVKRLLLRYGVTNTIDVQPTGIDVTKFKQFDAIKVAQLKEKYNISHEDRVLVSIGRLSQEKNIGEILHYLANVKSLYPHLKMLIAGDGPERKNLEDLIRTLHLSDRVIMTGEVDWNEVQNYYRLGQLFVCASTSETQGLTYLEAMACGLPILVRKDDCLKGFLKPGMNGMSYSTEEQFDNALKMLLTGDTYQDLRQPAIQTAENSSIQVFAERISEIYESIIADNNHADYSDAWWSTKHSMVG